MAVIDEYLTYQQISEQVYRLLLTLPRRNHITPRASLPPNGIYVFYEKGELSHLGASMVDRIVRIGTHKSDGRFSPLEAIKTPVSLESMWGVH